MLWNQTKQLPKEQLDLVQDFYKDNFPIEVRLQLASWIEEKFSPHVPFTMEDPNHQKMAAQAAAQLHQQLDAHIASMPNDPDKFLIRGNLSEIAESLKRTYATNPLGLYVTIRRCLEHEMSIVQMVRR